jgi:hypothetical protein
MNELVEVIDAALALVRHPDDPDDAREELSLAEVNELRGLASRAYVLAARLGLDRQDFPQIPDLAPGCDARDGDPDFPGPDLPPVQSESRFRLPGDWHQPRWSGSSGPLRPPRSSDPLVSVPDPVFQPAPPPAWFRAMADLREIVAAAGQPVGRPEAASEAPPRRRADPALKQARLANALVELTRVGPNAARIARTVGVPRTTLMDWPEFREAFYRQKAAAEERRKKRRGRRAGAADFMSDED